MPALELYQDGHRAREGYPRPASHQPFDHALRNFGVPPPVPYDQYEVRMEAMVHDQPVGGVAAPEGLHDPQHANIPYDMIGHYPQPLRYDEVPYEYPDVGVAQDVLAQGQPIAPENQEHNVFPYVPQHISPRFAEAAFPDPVAHRIPALGQPAVENLRRLAIRYVHNPASQVDLVSMQPSAAGHCKVVIVLEMVDIP